MAALPIGNFGETIFIPPDKLIEGLDAVHILKVFLNFCANFIISSYGPKTSKSSPPE